MSMDRHKTIRNDMSNNMSSTGLFFSLWTSELPYEEDLFLSLVGKFLDRYQIIEDKYVY